MITISQISVGKGYLTRHLSANDYYSEGEKVTGQWHGKGAAMLGLSGDVLEADFESLRLNTKPGSGEKLTARKGKVAFHDITLSAPKSVSIAAVVGGDERLVQAFHETVEATLAEMEKLAAVRVRSGSQVHTEATRRTGNIVAGVFHHDSSRALDPQLHAHAVLANASFDQERGKWFALQPVHMMKESKEAIRRFFYAELALRGQELGYQIVWKGQSFRLGEISPKLDMIYSQRMLQRLQFEQRFKDAFGNAPSKRRIEQFVKEGRSAAEKRFRNEYQKAFGGEPTEGQVRDFVKDWRDPKLARISTQEMRRQQRDRMTSKEASHLDAGVKAARQGAREFVGKERKKAIEAMQQSASFSEREVTAAGGSEQSASNRLVDAAVDVGMAKSPEKRKEKIVKEVLSSSTRSFDHARMTRREVLRRLKQGRRVSQAVRGLPCGLASHALRSQGATLRRRMA